MDAAPTGRPPDEVSAHTINKRKMSIAQFKENNSIETSYAQGSSPLSFIPADVSAGRNGKNLVEVQKELTPKTPRLSTSIHANMDSSGIEDQISNPKVAVQKEVDHSTTSSLQENAITESNKSTLTLRRLSRRLSASFSSKNILPSRDEGQLPVKEKALSRSTLIQEADITL
ncbi:unnamed protein product [Lepeophtheirus salmonis]|uniref:(salmon louse) hypothetical protein n=1 Tax=Lepeophtheirus salmonis TaxID=72036 RepID=A0A7R8CV09_LEPSM|nr:unnamed protein product [Lepeophtheirus salmonis]CAF2941209.1 unnamed protein product [Lepeophtheirus salmonis]